MSTRTFRCTLVLLLTIGMMTGTLPASAYESITAQEAYDMVDQGKAILIDVRTLEECYWVGIPDVTEEGLYIIPWELKKITWNGSVRTVKNRRFGRVVKREFGKQPEPALIMMCRSGGRSTEAAIYLESLGFENIYEIDNALKEKENGTGGRGGFQGADYSKAYDGYRGYPERLPESSDSDQVTVETESDNLQDADSSVSWMDTGLPVTQDLTRAIIP